MPGPSFTPRLFTPSGDPKAGEGRAVPSPTEVAIAYLRTSLDSKNPMRIHISELFAQKCPEYFALPERERGAFIMGTLPLMLRAFVASALFQNEIQSEDLPFGPAPLPLPADPDREDAAMFTFLEGMLDSWTASLNAQMLYHHFGAGLQSLVDPLAANYKYGVFMDAPTLEHADFLRAHPDKLAYVKSSAAPRHYSSLVWDTYIERFTSPDGNVKGRPEREPNSRLIEEHLDGIEQASQEVTL